MRQKASSTPEENEGGQRKRRNSKTRIDADGTTVHAPKGPLPGGKVLPPKTLLDGVTSVAHSANAQMGGRVDRLSHIDTRKAQSRLKVNAPVVDIDGERFDRQATRLTSSLTNIRERHATFVPITAAERERAAVFDSPAKGKSPKSGKPNDEEDDEEELFKEKVQAWKFVRKIETEVLPPLVHKPSELPPELHIVKDQSVVNFNMRSDVLMRNSPENQLEWLAYRGASREAHQCVVAEMRARRRADLMEKRKAAAFKVREKANQEIVADAEFMRDAGEDGRAARWIIDFAMLSFVFLAHEEIKLRVKLKGKQMEKYIKKNEPRLLRSVTTTNFSKSAICISQALRDPERRGRMLMISAMFGKVIRRAERRVQSTRMAECLVKWRGCGKLFLLLKRYAAQIKFIQGWWRYRRAKLQEAKMKFAKRWLNMERAIIIRDIKTRDLQANAPKEPNLPFQKSSPSRDGTPHSRGATATPNSRGNKKKAKQHSEQAIPMEERIQLQLIPEETRMTFIEHELRARRFAMLPEIILWEQDFKSWTREVAAFQEHERALNVMGVGGATHAFFRFPPARPTYLPPEFGPEKAKGNEELFDMIRRCRANPYGGGWTGIKKKELGTSVTTMMTIELKRKKREAALKADPTIDPDNPFGDIDDEDPLRQELRAEDLPTEFKEGAPKTTASAPKMMWRQSPSREFEIMS